MKVTTVPLTVTLPCAGVATTVTPVGAKPLNRQLARSRVAAELMATDIAQAAGAGTPIVNCTARLPGPMALVADSVAPKTPGVVGVPVMTPVLVLMASPEGRPVAL